MKTSFEKVLREVIAAERITDSARRLIDKAHRARSNTKEKMEYYKYFMEPLKSICCRIYDPFFRPGDLETVKGDDYGPDFVFKYLTAFGLIFQIDWKLHATTFFDPFCHQMVPVEQYVSMSRKQFYRYRYEEPESIIWIERNITNFDGSTKAGKRNSEVFDFANIEPKESWGYGAFRGKDLQHWELDTDFFHSQLLNGTRESVAVFRFDSLPVHKDFSEYIPAAKEKGVLF